MTHSNTATMGGYDFSGDEDILPIPAPLDARGPLHNNLLFESGDVEQIHEYASQTLCPHALTVQDHKKPIYAKFYGIYLNAIAVLNIDYHSPVLIKPTDEQDCFFIYTTMRGQVALRRRGEEVWLSPGETSVMSPAELYEMRLGSSCSRLVVMLQRDALEQRLCELVQENVRGKLRFDIGTDLGGRQYAAWLRALAYVCSDYAARDHSGLETVVNQSHTELLHTSLLTSLPHNYSDVLRSRDNELIPRHVRRAVEYVHANICRSISIGELAQIVAVTPRALQYGFRRYTGKTPSEYIRLLRLDRVHKELQRASSVQGVADILVRNGVRSQGSFVSHYKHKYGCTPSDTVRRSHLGRLPVM